MSGNFDYLVQGINEVEQHCQLFSDIRCVVNEELGIHYGATKASFKIMDKIKEKLNSYPKQYFANIDGASYRIGSFPFRAFRKTITVYFRYCNFRDRNFYNEGKDKLPHFPNSFKLSTLTLSIDIHAISGQIVDTTFSDTVQHEVEHYFQDTKSGKTFEDNNFYKAARFVKEYFGKNDETAKRIGNIMYFTRKCENEAYVNGLYALLVNNYKEIGKPTSVVIEESPVYQGLLQLRRDKEWLMQHKDSPKVTALLNVINNKDPNLGMGLNLTVNELIKYAEYSDREIVKRIGKAIVKAKKDCNQYNDLEPTSWK